MRRFLILIIIFSFAFACAGRKPNPVAEYQYGDEKKSCEYLKVEISQIDTEIIMKMSEGRKRRGSNVAVGVVGAVLFWPALFALDVSKADVVEMDALRVRRNHLVLICYDKGCGYTDLQQIDDIKIYAKKLEEEEKAKKEAEGETTKESKSGEILEETQSPHDIP